MSYQKRIINKWNEKSFGWIAGGKRWTQELLIKRSQRYSLSRGMVEQESLKHLSWSQKNLGRREFFYKAAKQVDLLFRGIIEGTFGSTCDSIKNFLQASLITSSYCSLPLSPLPLSLSTSLSPSPLPIFLALITISLKTRFFLFLP